MSLPVKTRSCDDLTKAGLCDEDDVHPMMSAAQRRLSDPNIAAHVAAAAAAVIDGHDTLVQNIAPQTPLHSGCHADNSR